MSVTIAAVPPLFPRLKSWALAFLFSAAGWAAIALALGWILASTLQSPITAFLPFLIRDWAIWALATPFLFSFVERFPLERHRLPFTLAIHLAVALVFLVAAGALATFLDVQSGAFPPPPAPGFLDDIPNPKNIPPLPPAPDRWLFGPQLPVYLAMLAGAHALAFYRRAQEREKHALQLSASLAEARLQALRMQIHPHFLFNSLNALAGLIPKSPERADEMLVALSSFLRLTLESSGDQLVPLGRELEYAERYLAIEQVRFGDRLAFEVDADPDTLAALVPSLLLQPLLENAVRHGIEPLSRGGRIVIRAVARAESLHLSVADDGAGAPAGWKEGVGLSNTRSRLRELYGDAASLRVVSPPGTTIEIDLPLRRA